MERGQFSVLVFQILFEYAVQSEAYPGLRNGPDEGRGQAPVEAKESGALDVICESGDHAVVRERDALNLALELQLRLDELHRPDRRRLDAT